MQLARSVGAVDRKVSLGIGGAVSLFLLYTGAKASWTIIFVLLVCIAMLWFAAYLAQDVLSKDEGTQEMQEVGLGREGCCILLLVHNRTREE